MLWLTSVHHRLIHSSLETYLVCFLKTSPMRGADAEPPHLAGQRSVSVASILSVEPCRVVVLSVPSSVPVPIAVAVVGFGVSVVQVGGLRSLRGRHLGFRSVRRFTAVAAVPAGDRTEILGIKKKQPLSKSFIKAEKDRRRRSTYQERR